MSQYIFFWKQEEKPYGCFSQWYRSSFQVDDLHFNCAEQYMMWSKAMLFQDEESSQKILAESRPWEQKILGRGVKNFDTKVWEKNCKDIVYRGNYHKFTQNPQLKEILFSTEGYELVEASPVDRVWGIGLAETDPRARRKHQWRGTNWLGEVLTKLREDLIDNE